MTNCQTNEEMLPNSSFYTNYPPSRTTPWSVSHYENRPYCQHPFKINTGQSLVDLFISDPHRVVFSEPFFRAKFLLDYFFGVLILGNSGRSKSYTNFLLQAAKFINLPTGAGWGNSYNDPMGGMWLFNEVYSCYLNKRQSFLGANHFCNGIYHVKF